MSNIVTATVTIEGTRPLLWNAFTLDAIPLKKKERTGVPGNDPEEWKRSVLADDEGKLYVPHSYIFACLRDGAKFTKQGRSSIQPLVVATLQVTDERVYTDRILPDSFPDLPTDPAVPVYLDVRSVKNPSSRARNIRYRVAASPGWRMTFHLLWDVTIVSQEQMKAVTIDAGQLCGLGDGRKIGFGRFDIVSFKVDVQR